MLWTSYTLNSQLNVLLEWQLVFTTIAVYWSASTSVEHSRQVNNGFVLVAIHIEREANLMETQITVVLRSNCL